MLASAYIHLKDTLQERVDLMRLELERMKEGYQKELDELHLFYLQ